uniref:Uncharacterized protein n=1 Tax=Knipowitschia caucasica TaxID=637954 RepID=A0AAV2MBK8_KNICA
MVSALPPDPVWSYKSHLLRRASDLNRSLAQKVLCLQLLFIICRHEYRFECVCRPGCSLQQFLESAFTNHVTEYRGV